MRKDNEYKEKASKRLRYILELNNMKQQDLADKSGVSKYSISQYLGSAQFLQILAQAKWQKY